MKPFLLVLCLSLTACGSHLPPPVPGGLPPAAQQAIIILTTVDAAAVALNIVQVCDPQPCHALVSTANLAIVRSAVTDAVTIIETTPAGWKATTVAALDRISLRLDAAGKTQLAVYLDAARTILALVT
jgi:hypothetical protein